LLHDYNIVLWDFHCASLGAECFGVKRITSTRVCSCKAFHMQEYSYIVVLQRYGDDITLVRIN
jgi:hypothetical protein